jgi:hypothetical protein
MGSPAPPARAVPRAVPVGGAGVSSVGPCPRRRPRAGPRPCTAAWSAGGGTSACWRGSTTGRTSADPCRCGGVAGERPAARGGVRGLRHGEPVRPAGGLVAGPRLGPGLGGLVGPRGLGLVVPPVHGARGRRDFPGGPVSPRRRWWGRPVLGWTRLHGFDVHGDPVDVEVWEPDRVAPSDPPRLCWRWVAWASPDHDVPPDPCAVTVRASGPRERAAVAVVHVWLRGRGAW